MEPLLGAGPKKKKIVKLILLKCNQNWHLIDSTYLFSVCVLCRCVSVCLRIIFFLSVIAVIFLCTVKVKQLKGRSDEFCMAAYEFPALLKLN